jgi:hypothetical protein
MNILAKIWSWIVLVWGVYAFLASVAGEEFDGYMLLGGLIMLTTALTALIYIWKDDEIKKQIKRVEEEERIAAIVTKNIKQ